MVAIRRVRRRRLGIEDLKLGWGAKSMGGADGESIPSLRFTFDW